MAFTDDYEFGGSILISLHKFDRPMGALPSPLRFLLPVDGDSESKERINLSVPAILAEILSCNVLKLILHSTLHLDHSRNIPKLYI